MFHIFESYLSRVVFESIEKCRNFKRLLFDKFQTYPLQMATHSGSYMHNSRTRTISTVISSKKFHGRDVDEKGGHLVKLPVPLTHPTTSCDIIKVEYFLKVSQVLHLPSQNNSFVLMIACVLRR